MVSSKKFFEMSELYLSDLICNHGLSLLHKITFDSFDNAALVLASDSCYLRLFLDRGGLYLDFAILDTPIIDSTLSTNSSWYSFDLIRKVLDPNYSKKEYSNFLDSLDNVSTDEEYVRRQLNYFVDKLTPISKQIFDSFKAKNFVEFKKQLDTARTKRNLSK